MGAVAFVVEIAELDEAVPGFIGQPDVSDLDPLRFEPAGIAGDDRRTRQHSGDNEAPAGEAAGYG